MFSGIVEEVGKILSTTDSADGRELRISAVAILADVKLGDSIACCGVCLTVIDFGRDWFTVQASHETLRRTKIGALKQGDSLNLERALRVSDRLGGHIVSGHVDAVAQVASIHMEGFSKVIEFSLPAELFPYFVEKGSVTVDGVSLTVASTSKLEGKRFKFTVALIPHTLDITTLNSLSTGDKVNIEADVIGKYVARLVSAGYVPNVNKGGLSLATLQEQGYT